MKFFLLCLCASHFASAATLSTSGTLLEEVVTQSGGDPHHYDWADGWTVDFGYGNVSEFNSFRSSYIQLGVTAALGDGWIALASLRRVWTEATPSSDKLAETPFSQVGQPTRFEFLGGAGFALLEGRSHTFFSPRITDVQHALYAIGGLQYNYFTSKSDAPIGGMQPAYYDLTGELGLRWMIFLPHSLGVGFDWAYCFPFTGAQPDLKTWQRFAGLVSWSFGH